MRYLNIISLTFFVFSASVLHAAGPPVCTLDGSGRVTNVDGGGSNDFCKLTPSELQVTLVYAGLCTSEPNLTSYNTACTPLFESSNGETVTLTAGRSLPLVSSMSLAEGTYTHAWILIENTVKIKLLAQFTPDRTGRSGSGPYCWTLAGDSSSGGVNENTPRASWLAECGLVGAADPQLTSSTIVAFFDFSQNIFRNTSTGTNSSGSYEVILIDGTGNESIVAPNGTSANPATQVGGKQTFTFPVVISANTSSVDVGFRLENNGGVLFGTAVTPNDIPRFGLGGFEFRLQSN